MSGIFGIFRRDGQPVTCAELQAMSDTLAHRGPDGHDLWHDGPIGLGHRMLWTTPESLHEQLPFSHKAAGLTITADARIDNRDELLSLLGLTDRPAEYVSDSQVILAAYEKWGEQCPEHLLGDFAFAIWDQQEQKLFCARDHFGVKPFYYCLTDQSFAFATEIKGLLCLPTTPRWLNELKIAEYLTVNSSEEALSTFFEGIFCVAPSGALTVEKTKSQERMYWGLDATREIIYKSDAEYADRFRELFTEAVRCRLRSAFPVGSMLSGGMDSSSITCVAEKLSASSGNPWPTFSAICPDVPECDERPYMDAVLEWGNYQPHYIHVDQFSPLTQVDQMLRDIDQGSLPGNLFENKLLYQLAHDQSVRVVLDGFDGDNVVSHGSGYFYELARQKRWLTLAIELRGYTKFISRESWLRVLGAYIRIYGIGDFRTRLAGASLMNPLRQFYRRVRGRKVGFGDHEVTTASPGGAEMFPNLVPEFLERSGFLELKQKRPLPVRTEREQHLRSLTTFTPSVTMETLDHVAANSSVEVRFPFMDKRLVEFCLALPPQQKIRRGWTRMILRYAMEGILPPKIQWRRGKTNYARNFKRGLLKYEREKINLILDKNKACLENYVKIDAVEVASRRFSAGSQQDEDVYFLWQVVSFALWLLECGQPVKPCKRKGVTI